MADDSGWLQTLPTTYPNGSYEPEVSLFAGANEHSLGLCYMVINLANKFFSISIRKDCQKQSAFNVTD